MFKVKGIFSWFSVGLMLGLINTAGAAQAPNPRAIDSDSVPRQTNSGTLSRRAVVSPTRVRAVGPTRVMPNGGRVATTIVAVRDDSVGGRATSTRVATLNRARSATGSKTNARAGRVASGPKGLARSATARATAVFNDVSKISTGYAACRESYATCMDQMCANANDTYRRCFCSDRFNKFRDIENSLDQAMIMLQQFQDNNLNAVDKTAAEVEAMYSPTVGELAIKNDTSAAAKALDAINDLLSGKSSSSAYSGSSGSLGILDLDFSTDLDDLWSGDFDGDSIFSSGGTDMSTLEGTALFNAAQKQCVRLTQNNCSSDALFSMSRSSYNILITQDCNIYEKTLNKKRETVASAVRMAEKYLREARLEEYRSHNSADVNECISKVRDAIFADTACGANYKRCLDPTGAYINGATGEPIYSPRLFQLEKTISLGGVDSMNQDILAQNPDYNRFLENYRKYVTRELDTCRDISDFVWTEFKRNAIIEIAQAQSAKIEEVKASCVDTMAECYDTQTNALKNMDKNTATTTAALGRYTARDMCREQVMACAALYGNNTGAGCNFDSRGHLTNSAAECGLTSLIKYVQAVDSLSVAEKCENALSEYVTKLCTPDDSTYSYPYNCKNLTFGSGNDNKDLRHILENFAIENCRDPLKEASYDNLEERTKIQIDSLVNEIRESMSASLAEVCNDLGGMWLAKRENEGNPQYLIPFYNTVFGGNTPSDDNTDRQYGKDYGFCYQSNARIACQHYEEIGKEQDAEKFAEWNEAAQVCTLYDAWYEYKCKELGSGYYMDGVCYIIDR